MTAKTMEDSTSTLGAFAAGPLTCTLRGRSFSGSHEYEILLPRHHFISVRKLNRYDHLIDRGSIDGKSYAARRVSEQDSYFVPRGRRWSGTAKGSVNSQILECDLDHSAFAQMLGDCAGTFELESHIGASLIAPGLLERLEALCLAPDAFPRAYADALTTLLACELFRARAGMPFPSPREARLGTSRFKSVVDHIEDTLENDTSLSDLAALMGLSVSHFSHAFHAAYGVAPHRYILRRRIEKAKSLLRVSDATIAAISARVGFSSQSRFTQVFARHAGVTPSAYRLEQMR
jgi:AraC-like DNA-binding protein